MKKLVLSLFFILTLTVSLFMVSAGARSIVSADIDIVLDKDGDAVVTEKWLFEYEPGEKADGFERNIDIYYVGNEEMSAIDKFGKITDVKAKVNGKDIPEADGDMAFSFSEKKNDARRKYYSVDIRHSELVENSEYEITYKVTDVVKKNGDNAVFSYMVIGMTQIDNCNDIYVDITFPEGVKQSDIVIPKGIKGAVSGNTVSYFADTVGNTFSVSASCNKEFFNVSSLKKYSENSQSIDNFLAGVKKALPFMLMAIGACIVVLFVLLPDRLVRFSLEKKVKKEMKAEPEKKFAVPENKTACECYKLLTPSSRIKPVSTAKKIPVLFAMAILECMENGYIVEDDEKLVVGTPKKDVPAYITSVLNFLKSFCTQKGNRYIIDKDFAERVVAECEVKYDLVTNYLSTFYSLVDGESLKFFMKKENQEFYKSVYALKLRAGEVKHKNSFSECMDLIFAGAKTKDSDVFEMMYSSSTDKVLAKGSGSKGEKELCEALTAIYKVFVKSK